MRRTRRDEILYSAYSTRIRAIEALDSLSRQIEVKDSLESIAAELRQTAGRLRERLVGIRYRQFATLLEATSRLTQWSVAVRGAEPDADRFLRSAKILAREVAREAAEEGQAANLVAVSARITELTDIDGVSEITELMLKIPLPIPVFAEIQMPRRTREANEGTGNRKNVSEVTVAFTSFRLDGKPLNDPQTIPPQVICDLQVDVSVSDWPENATTLELEAVSVEPIGSYEVPKFSFQRPSGGAPYKVSAAGRLLLQYSIAFYARPLEFTYRAQFLPKGHNTEVSVQGHRQLRVQPFDPQRDPQSGYREVDSRILELRNVVRNSATFPDSDINSFLTLLISLGRIAGQSVQDNLFPSKSSENEFQAEAKKLLRADPRIGSGLEEHPHAAGGITDLSFRSIRLELKYEDEHFVTQKDAEKFIPQTAQYVSGSDRRLGVLAILDCSPKPQAPGSVANDIFVNIVQPPGGGGLPIAAAIVIIRGNLSKPSDLSKKAST
ncbi:MAG: hypothetical protein ACJ72H_19405 [Candidatus Sulfotelmatobacter sp.]